MECEKCKGHIWPDSRAPVCVHCFSKITGRKRSSQESISTIKPMGIEGIDDRSLYVLHAALLSLEDDKKGQEFWNIPFGEIQELIFTVDDAMESRKGGDVC